MSVRCIAIIVALSVLASAGAAAAGRDVCASTMGCCATEDSARPDQACEREAERLERTCCCVVESPAAVPAAPVHTILTQDQDLQAPEPRWAGVAAHPAARLAPIHLRLPQASDRGPPPTSDSLLIQRIAFLL